MSKRFQPLGDGFRSNAPEFQKNSRPECREQMRGGIREYRRPRSRLLRSSPTHRSVPDHPRRGLRRPPHRRLLYRSEPLPAIEAAGPSSFSPHLPPPPSLSHTHSLTHTLSHTLSHTLFFSLSHTHSLSLSLSYTHTHTLSLPAEPVFFCLMFF